MIQDPVRMANSNSEERGFDLAYRLSRGENMIEEITRSQTWPTRSGATAGELRRFMDFRKAVSIRINDDILNAFIPETEKNFFTRHSNASWNTFAVTVVTSEGRKDSPEAVRAIAAITAKKKSKAHIEEEKKKRLRVLFCSYALIADCISHINQLKVIPQLNWENVKASKGWWRALAFFDQRGMTQGTEYPPFLQQQSASPWPEVYFREDTVWAEMPSTLPTDSSRNVASIGASRISEKGGSQPKLHY
ncbi:uncharacterized protein MONOS_17313 [Monocercomonoides exilis]|uniref:uncharacterized protein n=1 Tax=Monocercomonoides exilis TaxID=2049356 RepID=UPI003559D926|nr:hypothetical protein MONOS_17313 [Monocercomonoides exilis]